MSRLPVFFGVLCLITWGSVGCTRSPVESEIAIVDHNKHLEDNRIELLKWVTAIKSLAQVDGSSATGKLPEGVKLDFSSVFGTSTRNAQVNADFNALFLSTYSFGKEKPECFRRDPFLSPTFRITNCMLEGKSIGLMDSAPMENDDRYPSTAVAYMNATKQVKYVYLLDVEHFDRGNVNVYQGSMTAARLQGKITIYDLTENKLIALVPVDVPGFSSLDYTSKNTDGASQQKKTADATWDRKLVDHYKQAFKTLLPTLGR